MRRERASERRSRRSAVGWRTGRVRPGNGRHAGGKGEGRWAAISVACWQLYRVTLRRLSIRHPSRNGSRQLSRPDTQRPSTPLAGPPVFYISRTTTFSEYIDKTAAGITPSLEILVESNARFFASVSCIRASIRYIIIR